MNKKVMALAVAGALGAPGLAAAQVASSPGISFYGRLDMSIMTDKYSAVGTTTELKKGDIYSAGNSIGFRGREDLGHGTSAWFQLEIGVNPDGRQDAAATVGNNWGGRNSGLGLTQSWGDIMFGIWDAPYKVTTDQTYNLINSGGFSSSGIIMGNADTTGALPNAACGGALSNASGAFLATVAATATGARNVCVSEVTANSTSFHRRNNNTIQYWSPVMAGFQVKLATALANYQSPSSQTALASGTQKPKMLSGNLTWTSGPFLLATAYESHEGFRPSATAGQDANPKDSAWQIGGKFNFGMGQIGAGYEKLSYGDNSGTGVTKMDVTDYTIDGRLNLGPGAFFAQWAKTPGGKSCAANLVIGSAACGAAASQVTLGYDYILSKRTKVYLAYSKIDNGFTANGTAGTNYYYIAGPAGNAANGTALAVLAGTDVTTYAFGMSYIF